MCSDWFRFAMDFVQPKPHRIEFGLRIEQLELMAADLVQQPTACAALREQVLHKHQTT